MSRIIRCVACARRIRANHPHIGVLDYQTGVEFTYHARPKCQERALQETVTRLERGKVHVLRYHHVCHDEGPGFDCSGGCFDGFPDLPEAS